MVATTQDTPTTLKDASVNIRQENVLDIPQSVALWSLHGHKSAPLEKEALSAERQIKGWSRKKKEAMMRGDWAEVSRLAQSKSGHPSTSSGRTAKDGRLRDIYPLNFT